MEQAGPCVCARGNRGRMVHDIVGVGGDVSVRWGVWGRRRAGAGEGMQTIGALVGMQVPEWQGGVREAVCGFVHAMLDGMWCRLRHRGAGWAGHWEGTGDQQHAAEP